MKKHTRLLLWFIVITSVILAFTACNSNPATDGGSTEPSGSQLQMPVEKETGKERKGCLNWGPMTLQGL
ncbi:MAG TPA: hypothetical protein DCP98_06885 [Sphaerochaeta sp.]|nr:hypothetical protein [Sphaerochaeta sp.]